MPRYVILEHDWPTLHWDFMLEEGDHLATWRLDGVPLNMPITIQAERIGDHRVHYLDHEGPVSGNRGTVRRWDQGEYKVLVQGSDRYVVHLIGTHWQGTFEVTGTSSICNARFSPLTT